MLKSIGKQFRQPNGFLGNVVSSLMKKSNSFAYDTLLNNLEIKDQEMVFEIGYGHGLGIDRVLSKSNCHISGIDYSKLMYQKASKLNRKHIKRRRAELEYGDFLAYDIDPEKFDKIFCLNVVYFWDNLEEPFSKIRKGLKDKGTFCFYMAHADELAKLKFTKDDIFNKHDIENVIESLKSSGFSKIDFHYKDGYFVSCEK